MRWFRLATLLTFLLFVATGLADGLNAVIVVRDTAAKPALDPAYAGHFQTLLWPPAFEGGRNRLTTLMAGSDWRGEPQDGTFRPGNGGFVAVNYASLRKRGYFGLRAHNLEGTPVYAVSGPAGVGSAGIGSLLMALDVASPTVIPVPFDGPWPTSGLLAFEAKDWSEATSVAERVDGRCVILEMPHAQFATWGNFYIYGKGWPADFHARLPLDSSTGVGGLVRARNVVQLVLYPERTHWRVHPDAHDVAWRWFPYVRESSLTLLLVGMTALSVVIGFATWAISQERRSKLAAGALIVAGLAPAVLLVCGSLDRSLGLDLHWLSVILALAISGAALGVLWLAVGSFFPGSHPLLAPSLVGLVASAACDPKWSLLSGLFGYNANQYSPEAAGALVAYLTAVLAFSRGSSGAALWFGRACAAGVLAAGLIGGPWWAPNRVDAVILPLIALFAGQGWMRWPWLFILPFAPVQGVDAVRLGFAWTPVGCLTDARSVGAVNLFEYVAFGLYPGLWALGLIVGYVALIGTGFVTRQFRVAVRQDTRLTALPWAAASLFALGLLHPALLPASIFVAFSALVSVFHAGVWSL